MANSGEEKTNNLGNNKRRNYIIASCKFDAENIKNITPEHASEYKNFLDKIVKDGYAIYDGDSLILKAGTYDIVRDEDGNVTARIDKTTGENLMNRAKTKDTTMDKRGKGQTSEASIGE